MEATGVCRSDWHGWRGHDGDIIQHGLPFVPGHEASGIVVAIGPQVENLTVGDRVAVPFILACRFHCRECHRNRPTICERQEQPGFTMWGSMAEYVALPRADWNVCRLPSNVSFVEAAALGCRFTTAYRAIVQRGQLRPGQTVAVFGCGGVGLSCIMISACFGASSIIAVDVSEKALRKSLEIGATDVVQRKKMKQRDQNEDKNADAEVRRHVMEITNNIGADLSIDAAGFASTCENAVQCTRRGGRMVQVGVPIGQLIPPMGLVMSREIEIVGSHGFAAADLPAVLDLVATGRLQPKKLVEQEVDVEEGAKCIQRMDIESPLGITMVTTFAPRRSHL